MNETDAELGPGEYRDSVNVSGIVASSIIGGAALVLIIVLRLNAGMPVPALLFALLFPLAAVGSRRAKPGDVGRREAAPPKIRRPA
jgi:hypothetical protein